MPSPTWVLCHLRPQPKKWAVGHVWRRVCPTIGARIPQPHANIKRRADLSTHTALPGPPPGPKPSSNLNMRLGPGVGPVSQASLRVMRAYSCLPPAQYWGRHRHVVRSPGTCSPAWGTRGTQGTMCGVTDRRTCDVGLLLQVAARPHCWPRTRHGRHWPTTSGVWAELRSITRVFRGLGTLRPHMWRCAEQRSALHARCSVQVQSM